VNEEAPFPLRGKGGDEGELISLTYLRPSSNLLRDLAGAVCHDILHIRPLNANLPGFQSLAGFCVRHHKQA
jgi:hypothetical protein